MPIKTRPSCVLIQHVAVPRAEDQKCSALKATPTPLSHVRSNKSKRDPVESYFPALNEEGSAPLLGMVASCLTTPPSKVEATMRAIVARFSEILAADLNVTEHLLNRCFWRQISLLDAYQNRYSNLLYETGLAPQGATAPAPPFPPMDPAQKSTCTICLNVRDNGEFVALWCGHFCCKECWASHVKSRLHIDNVYGVACVQSECRASPTRAWLLQHFGEDSKTLKVVSVSVSVSDTKSNHMFPSYIHSWSIAAVWVVQRCVLIGVGVMSIHFVHFPCVCVCAYMCVCAVFRCPV